jgi:hypothetical protein
VTTDEKVVYALDYFFATEPGGKALILLAICAVLTAIGGIIIVEPIVTSFEAYIKIRLSTQVYHTSGCWFCSFKNVMLGLHTNWFLYWSLLIKFISFGAKRAIVNVFHVLHLMDISHLLHLMQIHYNLHCGYGPTTSIARFFSNLMHWVPHVRSVLLLGDKYGRPQSGAPWVDMGSLDFYLW